MTETIFISGIDTDAGKSYATGWIARTLTNQGHKVATVKFIQTGNQGHSEDIDLHRRIMGAPLPEDALGLTAPIIFSYPASAQLAARIDGRDIDLTDVDRSIQALSEAGYDTILIEGAGGLMVPITDDILTIDYPVSRHLPVGLVTNGRLGSISHTLLALHAIRTHNLTLKWLIYNEHFDTDPIISADTRGFLKRYVETHFPSAEIIVVPTVNLDSDSQDAD